MKKPVTPTYPGVYIEEIPSGVRTITPVATSITAFVGRAARGPVNEPRTINGFGDFERIFGGLWLESALGFAIRDFYANGGAQALIVRVFHPIYPTNAVAAATPLTKARLSADTLNLEAANQGAWGNQLRARVDHDVTGGAVNLFNLFVRDDITGEVEEFRNVSVEAAHPRRVDDVLRQSRFVRTRGALAGARPAAHADVNPGDNRWDNAHSSAVKSAGTASDGSPLVANDFTGDRDAKRGLYALEDADLFTLLVIPPYTGTNNTSDADTEVVGTAATYCEERHAMLLVDSRSDWKTKDDARIGVSEVGTSSKNAALFFPRVRERNPLRDNQLDEFVPSGVVAGIFARTDAARGVWKAPAGMDATFNGVEGFTVALSDSEIAELNPLAVNCLRAFPTGPVVWGARTLDGTDRRASEWKYIPVRRLALFIEETLYRGTQWVVFEPNDFPLYEEIRLNVGAFMQTLFRQGAFAGETPAEAYFVKCDRDTTTQNDVHLGIVNIRVGFAPLKPAEFVIINIQQMAGQLET